MQHKTVTILLRIRVRGHFVMSTTKYQESHYVTVLDNPLKIMQQPELPEILPVNSTVEHCPVSTPQQFP